MKNRYSRFVIFFCFLCVSALAFGQNTDGNSSKSTDQIKQESEFGYMVYLDSLLRINHGMKADTINVNGDRNSSLKRNRNSGNNPFSNYIFSSSGFSLFFQLLAIIFIIFLVYKLVLKNVIFSQRRKKYSTGKDEIGEPGIIEASQYNSFIQNAEAKENFNLAIKYYFLQVLKKLDELDVIQFSPDKTNQYYIYEIRDKSQQKKFASLVSIYENVWYGKFTINKVQYQRFKKEFENFLSIIN